MNELQPRYEITRKDSAKDKALKYGAWLAPVTLSLVPAVILFVLSLFSAGATTAMFVFLSLIALIVGFIFGLIITGGILYYRSRWLADVRERLAVDGVKANEVEWFQHELTSTEKKSLKEIEAKDLLLADAFRDTLAARLTATRILKSSKHELLLVERRQNKLKYLKSENSTNLQEELKNDCEKLSKIKSDAEEMRVEAETRLQMIEAAARRGGNVADTELALKKLSARTAELPLALESAKMEDEYRKEFEKELDKREV
ncbi:MAG: YIP1 family protein [Acidobacteriota bacterium]|nr:YIP1 family protein [Acidobacteriota bacterium]